MNFSFSRLVSLTVILLASSSAHLYSAKEIVPAYSASDSLSTGLYAYTARSLSKKAADYLMKNYLSGSAEDLNKHVFKFGNSTSEMMIHPGHPVLLQIDLAIVFWTAFRILLATRVKGEPVLAQSAMPLIKRLGKGFDTAYDAGMDTLCLVEAIQMAEGIYDKYYAQDAQFAQNPYISAPKAEESYALYTHAGSFLAGNAVGWASFKLGFNIALKITKDLQLLSFSTTCNQIAVDSLFVAIIFNIGITLSSLAENGIFLIAEQYEPFQACGPCKELFRLGGEVSYLWSDVFPNYKKLQNSIEAYGLTQKVKTS